jgi:hypothetical protein
LIGAVIGSVLASGPGQGTEPQRARVAGVDLALSEQDGRCVVSSTRGEQVTLAPPPPCWFAATQDGSPYTHAAPGAQAEAVIVVGNVYTGTYRTASRCGTESQAVVVGARSLRASARVARGGLRCVGEAPGPAEWWLFLEQR